MKVPAWCDVTKGRPSVTEIWRNENMATPNIRPQKQNETDCSSGETTIDRQNEITALDRTKLRMAQPIRVGNGEKKCRKRRNRKRWRGMPSSNFCAGRSKLSPRRLSCSGGISQGIKVVPVHKRNQKKNKLGGQKKKIWGEKKKTFKSVLLRVSRLNRYIPMWVVMLGRDRRLKTR